jgi:hypothetical protein
LLWRQLAGQMHHSGRHRAGFPQQPGQPRPPLLRSPPARPETRSWKPKASGHFSIFTSTKPSARDILPWCGRISPANPVPLSPVDHCQTFLRNDQGLARVDAAYSSQENWGPAKEQFGTVAHLAERARGPCAPAGSRSTAGLPADDCADSAAQQSDPFGLIVRRLLAIQPPRWRTVEGVTKAASWGYHCLARRSGKTDRLQSQSAGHVGCFDVQGVLRTEVPEPPDTPAQHGGFTALVLGGGLSLCFSKRIQRFGASFSAIIRVPSHQNLDDGRFLNPYLLSRQRTTLRWQSGSFD